jgi:hypothetical protein
MDKTQKDKIDCAIYGTNKEQIAKNIIGISKSEVDLILKNCLLDTEIVGVSEIQFDDSSKYHIRINYLGFGNVYFTQDYLASRVDLLYLEPNSKLFQGIISELNTEEDSFQYIYKKEYLPLLADGVIEVTTDTFSDVYNVLVWYSSDLIMVTYGSEERISIAALIYSNLDEIEGVEKIKETFFNHKSNGVFY